MECAQGALANSGWVARRLGTTFAVLRAAPAYLERHGEPQTPGDLSKKPSGIQAGFSRKCEIDLAPRNANANDPRRETAEAKSVFRKGHRQILAPRSPAVTMTAGFAAFRAPYFLLASSAASRGNSFSALPHMTARLSSLLNSALVATS